MSIYPANLVELMDLFPTEESCLEYLSLIRWPDGYVCTRCKSKDAWKMSSGLYRCQACRYDSSVISGTLFQEHTNHFDYGFMPYGMWLAKRTVSAHSDYKKRLGWVVATQHGNGYTSCVGRWLGQVAIN